MKAGDVIANAFVKEGATDVFGLPGRQRDEMVGGLFAGNYPSRSGMMASAVIGRMAGMAAGRAVQA